MKMPPNLRGIRDKAYLVRVHLPVRLDKKNKSFQVIEFLLHGMIYIDNPIDIDL